MIEENPNEAQRFFKKILCALAINEDETKITKASKKSAQTTRDAKYAFII